MKIPLSWLKKYIDLKITPAKLVEKLTNAGLEVSCIEKVGKDTVLEIEITSNRPDWLSILGIAREVAAITQIKSVNEPKTLPLKAKASMRKPFSIEIIDKKACPRYIGRLIKSVKISESPKWMKTALEAIGSRTINSGADITNYCMFETGQPMHAFDFDKLEGGMIIVRRAQKGESIVTIDGVNRKLDESILVIADARKPVAIAGIMGGIQTEVTGNTKNILLESAFFDPVTIRRASRKLGISTESNYRFERRVDTENVLFSSCRGAYLYKEICGGDISEPFLDVNYIKSGTRAIQISVANIERLVGLKISALQIKNILQNLGFTVKPGKGKESLIITVPSFRNDVILEEDLIEEIARIEGYDKIEETMPSIKAHLDPACDDTYIAKAKIRDILLGQGLNEIVTFTLLSSQSLDDAGIDKEQRSTLMNPLSAQQEALRTSLLPTILKVINTNLNRKVKDIQVFEIGKVYRKAKNSFDEPNYLGIALVGSAYSNWKDKSRPVELYDLKGVLEALIESFGISSFAVQRKNINFFTPDTSFEITVGDDVLAEAGMVHKKVLKNFDITSDVYFAQVKISCLVEHRKLNYSYQTVPKYPSVVRDIAIVINNNIAAAEALKIIKEIGAPLAKKAELFDVYIGDQVPEDCKSLAFSIEYQKPDATLTEDDVNQVHSKIQEALISRLKANLR